MSGETRPTPVLSKIITSIPVIRPQYGLAYLRTRISNSRVTLGFSSPERMYANQPPPWNMGNLLI
jgi:hypothetical protein